MTFHLQTSSATQSVHLIGSWDNFVKHYPMERDIKRARCQWRGCYKFEDIICDGDGSTSPKRTGGLKMGSTYYYYYELDDGTEIHDISLPSTTSCPFLPGQPVNLLTVPVEVQPLRYRSASMSSMANENIKTMEPGDKFMTPRPPPAPPALQRLKTSPAPLLRKRTARSISPKPPKSPWSPKSFFGLRSTSPSVQDGDRRGRSSSSLTKPAESIFKSVEPETNFSRPLLNRSLSDERRIQPGPHTRDASPQAFLRTRSREPSPLRQFVAQEKPIHKPTVLVIPDEIEEEAEDDDNFANEMHRMSLSDKVLTPLAPPPFGLRFPIALPASGANTPKDTSKPLPMLPEELMLALSPQPLRIRDPTPALDVPRSHFSMSTISTTLTSPSDSNFGFSATPSIADSNDDDDLSADCCSGDEFFGGPIKEAKSPFNGYSLPETDYTSEQSLQKEVPVSTLTKAASRTTFGGASPFVPSTETDVKTMNALEELLDEMGYLGDAITGK